MPAAPPLETTTQAMAVLDAQRAIGGGDASTAIPGTLPFTRRRRCSLISVGKMALSRRPARRVLPIIWKP
jgi:hypothetical protein